MLYVDFFYAIHRRSGQRGPKLVGIIKEFVMNFIFSSLPAEISVSPFFYYLSFGVLIQEVPGILWQMVPPFMRKEVGTISQFEWHYLYF